MKVIFSILAIVVCITGYLHYLIVASHFCIKYREDHFPASRMEWLKISLLIVHIIGLFGFGRILQLILDLIL